MPITVKLNGGVEIHVDDADFDALEAAFKVALTDNKPLQIHNPDGRTMVVNPHNILYLEGPTGPAAGVEVANNGQVVESAA